MNKNSKFSEKTVLKVLLVGVALGAVAVLATDKKRRQQMKDTWNTLLGDVNQGAKELKKKASKLGSEISDSVSTVIEETKKRRKR